MTGGQNQSPRQAPKYDYLPYGDYERSLGARYARVLKDSNTSGADLRNDCDDILRKTQSVLAMFGLSNHVGLVQQAPTST